MEPLAVAAAGMITGVGFNASSSCAAIRCAIDCFEETQFRDRGGKWIIGSHVHLDPPLRGRRKLIRMAVSAISECLPALGDVPTDAVPLLLCLAEDRRPGRLPGLDDSLLRDIARELSMIFHPSSAVVADGRVGGAKAVLRARELIDDGCPCCLIAGADTFLAGATLSAMEVRQRLLTSDNSNGFIPGEAGAAILVGPPQATGPEWICRGIGFGTETATIESDEPLRADGLAEALRAAMTDAECTFDDVDYRLTDANGEQYTFKEAALAIARSMRNVKSDFPIWHLADCIGEVGAATVPCALGVARAAAFKGYAPGRTVLAHFGNDGGARAAMILQLVNGGTA